jgi:hypothetical protein
MTEVIDGINYRSCLAGNKKQLISLQGTPSLLTARRAKEGGREIRIETQVRFGFILDAQFPSVANCLSMRSQEADAQTFLRLFHTSIVQTNRQPPAPLRSARPRFRCRPRQFPGCAGSCRCDHPPAKINKPFFSSEAFSTFENLRPFSLLLSPCLPPHPLLLAGK